MAKSSRYFGCQVPPGGAKKGCGGGAKVVDIEKIVKRLEKRVEKGEVRIAKVEAHVKKKGARNVADGVNRRRPGGTVDR